MTTLPFRLLPAGLLALSLTCRPAEPARDVANTGEAPDLLGARVNLPARWTGRVRIDTLSTQERGAARPGAREYYYHPPLDTTIPEQVLAVVAVYDSASWAAARSEEGPPPGDSVHAHAGRVYIVGLPQSNPYRGGTPDSAAFDSLQLTRAELGGFVTTP